jgi:tryptophan-rich sensory protein
MDSARRRDSRTPDWLGLAGWVLLCFAAAGLGSAFTATAVQSWYPTLNKPPFNPPAWVFGPVWSVLYAMMAVAAWRVWRKQNPGRGSALGWFGVQLALNVLWSVLFFGARQPGWAFAEIALLWAAILATLLRFHRLDRVAGWLLAPYLAWVSFASILNLAVWLLNR